MTHLPAASPSVSGPISSQAQSQYTSNTAIRTAAVLLLVAAFFAPAHAQTLLPNWVLQSPATSPPADWDGAMAYDAAHRQVVLYGGFTGSSNETWLWNGTNWSKANPLTVPTGLTNQAMAYDAAHGQVVMFGGSNASSTRLNETWLWNGTDWSKASPVNSPPARNGAAMVYDAAAGEVVLFGGVSAGGSPLGDTWLWDGTNWTAASPGSSPTARFDHAMAYDAAHGQVVLFGGLNGSFLNDTWVWNGTWAQQNPATSPGARYGEGMDYHAALGQVVMFGGYNGSMYLGDTWTWDGTHWTQQSPATNPSPSYATNAMVYDAEEGGVVMFGGYSGGNAFSTTWVWGLPQNFGNIDVCPSGQSTPAPCSVTLPLTFSFAQPSTIVSVNVVTQGANGLDFSKASGGDCAGGINAGSSCTMDVTFTPLAPGLRTGAVQLLVNSQSPDQLTTIPIYGNGLAPEVAFGPATTYISTSNITYSNQVTAVPNLNSSNGMTTDAAGNLYQAVGANLLKVVPGGTPTTVATGFGSLEDVAIDGAGNLYVADSSLGGFGEVVKLAPGCANATASCASVLYTSSSLPGPFGVAVNGSGDVFISKPGTGVFELPAGCSNSSCQITLYNPGGSSRTYALAVDAAGDLFVPDSGLKQVVKIPAGCTSALCQTLVGVGWVGPQSVAVDAAGDVIVADPYLTIDGQIDAGGVVEVPAGCTTSSCQILLWSGGAYDPFFVAVTAAGQIFIATDGTPPIIEVNQPQAPSLAFNTTYVGFTSDDSPKSLTFQNIGNQTLNAISPGLVVIEPNFVQVPGSGTSADCTSTFSLTPGADCNVSVRFSPQAAGLLNSTTAFTDNALNGAPAQQVVALSGGALEPVEPLNLTGAGTGNGSVTASPTGINCSIIGGIASGTCSSGYPGGTGVSLEEVPSAGYTFTGWGGACASSGTSQFCNINTNVGSPTNVSASFSPVATSYTLSLTEVGTGSGMVSDDKSQISCSRANGSTSGTCSGSYAGLVTLTATASGNSIFAGWGGACAGAIPTCGVTVNAALNVTASFVAPGAIQTGMLKPITAGVVYGQGGRFTSNAANYGGVSASSLSNTQGMVVDNNGNLYVSDGGNNRVLLYPAGSTTATRVYGQNGSFTDNAANNGGVSANSLSNPQGIAIDSSGNLYVADQNNNRVLFYPAGSTTATRVYGQNGSFTTNSANSNGVSATTLAQPFGLALDNGGSLYVTDYLNNRVLFYPSGSTTATQVYGQGGSFTSNNMNNGGLSASSLNQPTGVALDSSGDLYVADIYNNRVLFYPYGSTTATEVYGQGGSFSSNAANNGGVTASSLNNPMTIALDSSGDLYVVDRSNNRVLFYPFGSTAATRVYGQANDFTASSSNNGGLSANSLSQPWAVALDASGNLYVTDYSNNRVLEYGTLGNVNVCPSGQSTPAPCNTTITLSYFHVAATTLGATQVVTQGATGLDFTLASGGTCTGGLAADSSCTVNVTFTPLAPGSRMGAVTLLDYTGNPVATAPLYGIGQGPLAAFSPGAQVPVSTSPFSLSHPAGILTDASGNLFISDVANKQVLKIAPNGSVTSVGFGFLFPQGMAEDGAGNLFVADNNKNAIVEIPAGCASINCQVYLGSNYRSQLGVAVDGAGNVFFGDFLDGKVVAIPAGCTSTACQKVVYNPGGGSDVVDLTVDGTGNLFVADYGLKEVVEVPPGCASSSCLIPIGSGWMQPDGVAVDAAGDVFVADEGLDQIVEVPAGCTTSACQVVVVKNVNTVAVKLDPSGDLFYDNLTTAQVAAVTRSLPPSIGFALTNVGSTSTDSPQSVSVQNIGNQLLTGTSASSLGTSFTPSGGTCTTFSLVPGASCSESFSFTPQATGYFIATASFSDNTLNLSPAVVLQSIKMSGIGGLNGQAVTTAVPNVVGLTQPAAGSSLVGAGLVTGSVSTASSSIVPSGSVIASNPAAGTQVNLGSSVKLLVSSGAGQPPAPNPLSLLNNYFVTGDYAAAGVTLRGAPVVNNMVTGTINIPTSTGPLTNGVPTGADLIDGFLYWTTLENSASPSGSNAIFLGYPISGQQIGSDLPYTDTVASVSGTLRVYRADVNTWFQNGTNGTRTGSGNFTVSLPAGGAKGVLLSEGASLVVIYRVLSPNFPLKAVVIYDGSAIPPSSTTQNVLGFYDAAGGASISGNVTTLFVDSTGWNNTLNVSALGQPDHFNAPLNAGAAYSAVILSTLVNNPDNDGILGAWKAGPPSTDFHGGQPGYYDVKTGAWVGLPGAKSGQKDLFVQLDYMCGAVLGDGSCDPAKENLFPSPDSFGNDPLAIVQQAFANAGVALHLQVGNAVPETNCTDSPGQPCQFPGEPGVIGWKNSLEFSKVWPRNFASCVAGGDCSPRFPYGQKDSYHYVLFGHSLAIPAWNTRYQTLTTINAVAGGTTTFVTTDRGAPGTILYCPSRITVSGIQGMPSLNGVYNTTSCPDSKTMIIATPAGVTTSWTYPNNTLPEPVIGITSGTVTSISGYSDLGGADSAVTLGLWETAQNQDMSKKATVIAGTLFHELGHTIGLSHGGLYYDSLSNYVPTFEANCKPNYQSIMNYLFQLDGVGPASAVALSNQTLTPVTQSSFNLVTTLVDTDPGFNNVAATFPTSTWYTPTAPSSTASAATLHCDGTPLGGDVGYRVNGPIAPTITPAWASGQNITFDGQSYSTLRGFNDIANIDLRQVGATGGQFASLASVLSFDSSATPLNIAPGGSVAVGPGGTVTLGAGGSITVHGGNVTVPTGGSISGGGTITFGTGGSATLSSTSTGTITAGSNGIVALPGGGNVTLGAGGTITLGGGGTVTLGAGGNVTLGAGGGTINLPGGGSVTIPSTGGSYTVPVGGTVTLGAGGNVTLGAGGNVTLGAGGNITLGAGGNVTLGGGGNVTLGAGGTITLGGGGNITLGGGGNVTLGAGGTITLGGGGNVTLGGGGNVTLGGGGNVTLGAGGNITLGGGGNVTLGAGGTVTLGAGGNITLGGGGTVTLGGGGNVTLGAGGTITLGGGGTITMNAAGNVTLGAGGGTINGVADGPGTYPVGAGGTITLGGGGNVTLGAGGNVTLGGGGNVTLGAGGNITLGGGGTVTLGGGGNVTLGAGGNVTLGAGGNVTLGAGGNITLGGGGNVTLGGGGAASTELDYSTANSIVRPPTSPTETSTTQGVVVNWTAPGFGVVQTYTIYRSTIDPPSTTLGPAVVIGSVSGVGGNPPATTFTDTNPDTTATTVVYTITTTLAPDPGTSTQRQSAPSTPAVLTVDQTIVLAPLPSSVSLSNSSITVTATAKTGAVANMQLVSFTAAGPCSVGASQLDQSGNSSATVTLNNTGSCTITASQAGDSTTVPVVTPAYNAADPVSGTFMIVPQGSNLSAQTITFPQLPTVQYGSSPLPVSATALPSGFSVTFTTSGQCNNTTNNNMIVITGAGKCTVTASAPSGPGPNSTTYSAASATQSFNIAPAVLTVKAGNLAISYGQPIPSLTNDYTITGYVNSESSSVLNNSAPALSTTATSTSVPGAYPITVSTGNLAATNYSFLYMPGTLTIQTATATISISNIPPNPVYGGSFTPAYLYSGTGTPTESTTSSTTTVCTVLSNGTVSFVGVGTCTLTASATATANNSAATGTPQSFSVGMATATISISNIPMNPVYGGSFTPTYSYSGTGSPTESTTSSTTSVCKVLSNGSVSFLGVGNCTLTASATATTDDLAVTGSPQNFSVAKASQAITFAQPTSPVTYGVSPLTLAATSTSGLPVLLTIDASSTAPATVSGSTVTIKGAGILVLDANQAGNAVYTAATSVQRSIVVNQALLTVTANNLSRVYGAANPTLTVTYTGFVNPDGPSVLTGSPSLSTTALATSLPGLYPITVTQGTLAAKNYTFKFVNGTLTVTYTATVPASGTACNGVYSGIFMGSLTVSKGQNCIFIGGGTSGSITETGGNLVLNGSTIGSSVTISSGGTFTIGPSTTIKDSLTIQGLTKSTATNQVCGTTINSSLVIQSDSTAVLIGSGTPSCAGNIIKGSLQVASNPAAVTMDGNKVSGSVQVQSNAGATIIDGNTVGVSMQVQSNTGATQIFSNVISNALQCQSNTSITGGGNTAPTKQGQCAKF